MADRLTLLRLLDVYAANWALLLGSRDLKLMARVRQDFDSIHLAQRTELPSAAMEMMELLLAHEALENAVADGTCAAQQLAALHRAQEDALQALRSLVARTLP